MRGKNIVNIALVFCWGVLFFFCASILARMFVQRILVNEFRWDNAFVRAVLVGNPDAAVAAGAGGGEIIVDVDWEKLYPFRDSAGNGGRSDIISELSRFERFVFDTETKIKLYTTYLLIGQYGMTSAARAYNELIGCSMMKTQSSSEVIYLNNGYLAWREELVSDGDIEEIADGVRDFSEYLESRGIGFVYMNMGSKVCPYDRQLPVGADEHSNENGDRLVGALEDRSVDVLDFRDCMIRDGLDWYGSYYMTDVHWKTTTALWAAGVMARYLNDNFGFDFDGKYFDPARYDMETYPDYFLGGQGRTVTLSNCDLEAYDRILPEFETSLSLKIPSRDIDMQGTYRDVLFCEEEFDEIAGYSDRDFAERKDAYHAMRLRNDAYGEIRNLDPEDNKDKKILLIYDSFGWYPASFLATDVSEIVTLYLGAFNGSVRTLVDEMEPDVVIMAYSERSIDPVDDRDAHTEMFDLR